MKVRWFRGQGCVKGTAGTLQKRLNYGLRTAKGPGFDQKNHGFWQSLLTIMITDDCLLVSTKNLILNCLLASSVLQMRFENGHFGVGVGGCPGINRPHS
jgi:hypothetical protein